NASGKTAAIVTEKTPSGQFALAALQASVPSAGLNVTYAKASLPVPGTGDDEDIAHDIMGSANGHPPDAVFVVGTASSINVLQVALRGQGFTGVFTDNLQYGPQNAPIAVGATIFLQVAP